MKILHYGLQRSGTNFLEKILTTNYRVKMLNNERDRSAPNHKHCRIYDEKKLIPEPRYKNSIFVSGFDEFEALFNTSPDFYVVISKDPYSWYLSYVKWAQQCQWPSVTHNYILEYNHFYGKFLELSRESSKFVFVRYVDMLSDLEGTLGELENRMGLEKSRFVGRRIKSPDRVSQSAQFSQEERSYYVERKYLSRYDPDSLGSINEQLDLSVLEGLGYSRCNLGEFPS